MNTVPSNTPEEHRFDEVTGGEALEGDRLGIEDLKAVRLVLTADLGQATLMVREILELKQGSVIPLNRLAGEMTDICINGVPVARGEVVVIADEIHVRVGEVFGVVAPEKDANGDDY